MWVGVHRVVVASSSRGAVPISNEGFSRPAVIGTSRVRTDQPLSDPFVVVVLSLSFIASIFFLHIAAKIVRAFTK